MESIGKTERVASVTCECGVPFTLTPFYTHPCPGMCSYGATRDAVKVTKNCACRESIPTEMPCPICGEILYFKDGGEGNLVAMHVCPSLARSGFCL